MSRRALLVDATHLLERGFATVASDRVSPSGEPTSALYAVAAALGRALAFKQPDVAVAVVDAEPDSTGWPELLTAQLPRLAELLQAYGFPAVTAADPAGAIASYTRAVLEAGCDVVIAGSDKRFAQLVSDQVWWYDAYKDVRYTPELVRKRFEVGPDQVAEWLALVGDQDRLPGIKGIGKKGATRLLEQYGAVAAALEDLDAIGGRTGNALRADLEGVDRELGRAVLDAELPLPSPIDELEYQPPRGGRLQELFAELGFVELLATAEPADLAVEVCRTGAEIAEAIAAFDPARPIAVWPVVEDPSPVRGELAGLALAQGDRVIYAPLPGDVPPPLAALLADPERPLIGHDTKAFVVALARRGVAVSAVAGDSACASHLTEPSNWAPHDLEVIAPFVLRRALPDDDSVRGVGRRRKRWSAIDVEVVARHAGSRAVAAAECWEVLGPRVDAELLSEYLALSDTLARMEQRGIACDAGDLARAGDDFDAIAAGLESEIFELAGKSFNLGSTKQLGSVLFEDLGLEVVKRTKTGWSTATEALERIEHSHPIVSKVIRWRLVRRLRDSWVTALTAAIDGDGRVRSTFYPARSFSGRLVNANPDLGRVPGRTPEMQRIRRAFGAAPGAVLLSVDYRQLGLYVLAHLTGDPALIEPLASESDIHRLTAAAILELEPDQIDADQRQLGKLVNFATFAGQGASALALQLGVDAAEAKTFIERFDRRYARVRTFQDGQLALARERGWLETIAGRRWPIGELESPDPMIRSYAERMARRATHEGSVADVSRRGLLRADQALRAAGLAAAPLLQVHDEVLFEVPEPELGRAAEIAAAAMREAFDLTVPLRVGCKAGPSWAQLDPIEL